MSTFWKTVLLVGLFVAAMLALTFFVKDIRVFAEAFSLKSKIPIWIVGLFAPILFLFQRLGEGFKGLFSPSGGSIAETIERIERERKELRRDVDALLKWRDAELQGEREEIARLKSDLAALRTELLRIDNQLGGDVLNSMSDQEIRAELERRLRARGYVIEN